MVYRSIVAALGAAVIIVACSDATGTITGGEPRDGGATADATSVATDGGGGGGDSGPCGTTDVDGGVPTFTTLYGTIFGPSGRVSCAGNGQCHGDPTQEGAVSSGGYVCSDKATCYNTMVASAVIIPNDPGDPEGTTLYGTVRHIDPQTCSITGSMPLSPPTVLTAEEMQGIFAWTKAGAPNN